MTRFLRLGALALLALAPALAAAQPHVLLPNMRPYDQSGTGIFEPPKEEGGDEGLRLRWGVGFTQQFQALDHSNAADPVFQVFGADTVNVNELIDIGPGFNLATANLNLDAQLAEGIRVSLVTYLSSRHHPEAWVKGGYVQVDELPFFNSEAVDRIMDLVTIRAGHMEINYGDAHFRRTDNGNAMYNPFVGNLIMDAFATEIGGEVYVRSNGFLGMVGVTDGEIQGSVLRGDERNPSFYGKLGVDRQLNPNLRVRLTGSAYTTSSSLSNTLYSGDRAGSRYYLALENTRATPAAQFTSGRFNPGFRDAVTAFMINPFVKFAGAEVFGTLEFASGRAANETEDRAATQIAIEGLYRFLPREQAYVGARYNTVSSELFVPNADPLDVSINRIQIGAGWFATPNLLMKAEYVIQNYNDFAPRDIRHEGEFKGLMFEGVIAF